NRCLGKNHGKLDRRDTLLRHSRLGGWRWDHVRRLPALSAYNRERIWSDTGAVFQRANRVRRQRTSGDSLPVESIPDLERNRIRVTRIHRRLGQKVQHKRRGRSKSAHVLRGAIAVGGLAASRE